MTPREQAEQIANITDVEGGEYKTLIRNIEQALTEAAEKARVEERKRLDCRDFL